MITPTQPHPVIRSIQTASVPQRFHEQNVITSTQTSSVPHGVHGPTMIASSQTSSFERAQAVADSTGTHSMAQDFLCSSRPAARFHEGCGCQLLVPPPVVVVVIVVVAVVVVVVVVHSTKTSATWVPFLLLL